MFMVVSASIAQDNTPVVDQRQHNQKERIKGGKERAKLEHKENKNSRAIRRQNMMHKTGHAPTTKLIYAPTFRVFLCLSEGLIQICN
jgi:hypothetical protein